MRKATLERQEMERFSRYWERLFQEFPDARRRGAEAMGEAVRSELSTQIQATDLETDAKGTVRTWQEVRIGSRGGYAAVSPRKEIARPREGKQHTYLGSPVTQKQVTRWLERGHGTPATGRKRWNFVLKTKKWHQISERRGGGYVKGRLFYSWTKMKAWEIAKRSANDVLSKIADEVDF